MTTRERPVAIVTDSCAALSAAQRECHAIVTVPVIVDVPGTENTPPPAGSPAESLQSAGSPLPAGPALSAGEQPPAGSAQSAGSPATTSRPSVHACREALEDASRLSSQIVAVHVSGRMSGTVDNMRAAAEQFMAERDVRVDVIDSGHAGGGLGLSVLAACSGTDLRSAAGRARECAARAQEYFMVPDLAPLRRGGRIDRSTALLGSAVGIMPVLHVEQGRIMVADVVRGRRRAMRSMMEAVLHAAGADLEKMSGGQGRMSLPHLRQPHMRHGRALRSGSRVAPEAVAVMVSHSDAEDLAEQVYAQVSEQLEQCGVAVAEGAVVPVDAALRAHVGSGAVSVACAPARLLS